MVLKISKRIRRLLTTFSVVTLISAAAYILGWSSFLTVSEVSIEGTQSTQVVINKLITDGIAPVIGSKLARVDTRAIKHTISKLDWISQGNISRNWFSKKISIEVVERVAVAKAITAQGITVNFDNTGTVFTPTSDTQLLMQYSLPQVTLQGGSKEELTSVALLLEQIPVDLNYLITDLESISVSKSGYIQMKTQVNKISVQINWGKAEEVKQKCSVLIALLKLPENQGIKKVDLSQPSAPIVS
jgi:cell division septal protein FtsQ